VHTDSALYRYNYRIIRQGGYMLVLVYIRLLCIAVTKSCI